MLSVELEELDIDMEDFGFENLEVDLDFNDSDFVQDTEITKSREKEIICPHCGEKIIV